MATKNTSYAHADNFSQRITTKCISIPVVKEQSDGSTSVTFHMDQTTLRDTGISLLTHNNPEYVTPIVIDSTSIEDTTGQVPGFHYFSQLLQLAIDSQIQTATASGTLNTQVTYDLHSIDTLTGMSGKIVKLVTTINFPNKASAPSARAPSVSAAAMPAAGSRPVRDRSYEM